jgi:hypothetical protein
VFACLKKVCYVVGSVFVVFSVDMVEYFYKCVMHEFLFRVYVWVVFMNFIEP